MDYGCVLCWDRILQTVKISTPKDIYIVIESSSKKYAYFKIHCFNEPWKGLILFLHIRLDLL